MVKRSRNRKSRNPRRTINKRRSMNKRRTNKQLTYKGGVFNRMRRSKQGNIDYDRKRTIQQAAELADEKEKYEKANTARIVSKQGNTFPATESELKRTVQNLKKNFKDEIDERANIYRKTEKLQSAEGKNLKRIEYNVSKISTSMEKELKGMKNLPLSSGDFCDVLDLNGLVYPQDSNCEEIERLNVEISQNYDPRNITTGKEYKEMKEEFNKKNALRENEMAKMRDAAKDAAKDAAEKRQAGLNQILVENQLGELHIPSGTVAPAVASDDLTKRLDALGGHQWNLEREIGNMRIQLKEVQDLNKLKSIARNIGVGFSNAVHVEREKIIEFIIDNAKLSLKANGKSGKELADNLINGLYGDFLNLYGGGQGKKRTKSRKPRTKRKTKRKSIKKKSKSRSIKKSIKKRKSKSKRKYT